MQQGRLRRWQDRRAVKGRVSWAPALERKMAHLRHDFHVDRDCRALEERKDEGGCEGTGEKKSRTAGR